MLWPKKNRHDRCILATWIHVRSAFEIDSGAPQFGARARAGNSLQDIAALVRHAHSYWARVYVTVNTLLYDHEPPLPLIASTQMHNHTPERVAFLEAIGFRRVILARELSLDQIRAIAPAPPWSSSISSTGRCVFPTAGSVT